MQEFIAQIEGPEQVCITTCIFSIKKVTTSGYTNIYAPKQIIGKAIAGEIFGEIGVLCGRPQPFSVRTTEISQILRLNRTTLMNILRANPEDERIIMNNLLLVSKSTVVIA